MSNETRESFMQRWLRLKQGDVAGGTEQGQPAADHGGAADVRLPTFADLETLDATSDFSSFLLEGVSPELRAAALRILWASDPRLSACDGLIDYAGDYTCSESESGTVVEAAFRIGKGLLDDDEAAAWARLGCKEKGEAAPRPARSPKADEREDR